LSRIFSTPQKVRQLSLVLRAVPQQISLDFQ